MRAPLKIRNPRSGRDDYEIIPAATEEIVAHAGDLRMAAPAWRDAPLNVRAEALRDFGRACARHRDALLDALVADTGRYRISVGEVDAIASVIERNIALAEAHDTPPQSQKSFAPDISFTPQYVPFGLVGVISPWNFPLTLSLIDALPALLAGCAVIIKPSEITPRFAEPLRVALADSPALAKMLRIIDGDGASGAALVDAVDAVCFTGSVATGRKVAVSAAENFIPAFLELGGKDPAIVLADADIDHASTALLRGSIVNTGQACQSIERIYVAREIYAAFCTQLVDKARGVRLNNDNLHEGHLGPFIFGKQADIVRAQIADAQAKGATIHSGGEIIDSGGQWCLPTVITDLRDDMEIMQNETFGPLLPIIPFDSEADAIAMANDSVYGLSAAVFSQNIDHAHEVGRSLEVGAVCINDAALTSFVHDAEKNAFKLSGMGGSRMGAAGYSRFFRRKSLILNRGAPMPIAALTEET